MRERKKGLGLYLSSGGFHGRHNELDDGFQKEEREERVDGGRESVFGGFQEDKSP